MNMHCPEARDYAHCRYIHVFSEREVRAKAAELAALHARVVDVAGLSYDDLAHQVLVRDLRKTADDLGIQNYVSFWTWDELSGKLEVAFDFGSTVDMASFKSRVG